MGFRWGSASEARGLTQHARVSLGVTSRTSAPPSRSPPISCGRDEPPAASDVLPAFLRATSEVPLSAGACVAHRRHAPVRGALASALRIPMVAGARRSRWSCSQRSVASSSPGLAAHHRRITRQGWKMFDSHGYYGQPGLTAQQFLRRACSAQRRPRSRRMPRSEPFPTVGSPHGALDRRLARAAATARRARAARPARLSAGPADTAARGRSCTWGSRRLATRSVHGRGRCSSLASRRRAHRHSAGSVCAADPDLWEPGRGSSSSAAISARRGAASCHTRYRHRCHA
jgi:hypothetical protein